MKRTAQGLFLATQYQLSRAITAEQIERARAATIGTALLLVDQSGAIVECTPRAHQLLEEWFGQKVSIRLPPELENWLKGDQGTGSRLVKDTADGHLACVLGKPTFWAGLVINRFLGSGSKQGTLRAIRMIQFRLAEALSILVSQGLTEREAEVLYWMMQARQDSEIATILDISVRTANAHVRNIIEKLQATNRVDAALRAMELLLR